MSLWGVVLATDGRSPDGTPRDDGALAASLAGSCDGLTVVPAEPGSAGRRPSAGATRLARLVAGLAQVPEDVGLVLLVDEGDLGSADPDRVRALHARLEPGVAAVAFATPVADALKRVEGDEIVGGVDRAGLYRPRTPQLIRRAALDQALPLAGAEDDDPATLLSRSGHTVLVVEELSPARPPETGAAGASHPTVAR